MDALEKYILEISEPEADLLRQLDRETNLKVVQPRMISGHVQAKFLEILAKMMSAVNVLEIGTFTGYTTHYLAAGVCEGGSVDTIEVDDELETLSRSFFAQSPHCGKINLHVGSALEIVPKLNKIYDMVFLDGDKREYPDYYRMLMGDRESSKMLKSGSVIIADNILWYGKVAFEAPHNDRHTSAIQQFNKMVSEDDRVESVVINIRDGLNLIRVK